VINQLQILNVILLSHGDISFSVLLDTAGCFSYQEGKLKVSEES